MVKNSGQKNRTKRYAAEHGISYQQAREALGSERTATILDGFIKECGSTPDAPEDVAGNIPYGLGREGVMQWVFPTVADDGWNNVVYTDRFEDRFDGLIEVVGGPGTGKTTLLSRMIAHHATENPQPRSVALFAGAREFGAAQARWKDWPQVIVIGPNGQVAGSSVNARIEELSDLPEFRVFDDWFTGQDGLLPRRTRDEIAQLPITDPVRWRAKIATTALVAAFRPGHVSHVDESEDVRGAFAGAGGFTRGFTPRDEFVFDSAEDSDAASARPADIVLIPDGTIPYVWEARLDGRRLGLPTEVHVGPGRIMFAEEPAVLTEASSPEKVREYAEFVWQKRDDDSVDVDFPFTSGPRNANVRQEEGGRLRAFPCMDVFPLDLDTSTDAEVDEAIEKALAAYWSIEERGSREVEA